MLDDAVDDAHPKELETAPGPDGGGDEPPPFGSLADDVSALFEDGKTYLEAEVAFQKTRVAYVGDKAREGLVFGLGALAFLHLALIGLVIGLIFALAPYLTAFGSTAVVVGILLIGTVFFARRASRRFGDLGDAFTDPAERNEQD
ncbi:MAG: phage holin family protein [Erythrobacter sp.]|nr:phage holin family protein [Erythrobacter sp.]RZV35347.1 MAG: phage holin family protein [Sphingomonadaceae bacterium]